VINENWERWIAKALTKHFRELDLFMQLPEMKDEREQHAVWFQMSYVGPEYIPACPGYTAKVQVNILVQYPDQGALFQRQRYTGKIAAKFTCIPVYDDANNLLGVLEPVPWNDRSLVNTVDYGTIPELGHARSLVIGDYAIDL
jgi:hypothetical protein